MKGPDLAAWAWWLALTLIGGGLCLCIAAATLASAFALVAMVWREILPKKPRQVVCPKCKTLTLLPAAKGPSTSTGAPS